MNASSVSEPRLNKAISSLMERAQQSPNTVARRQALLAALAIFLSAAVVGGCVYLSAEAVLRNQLEQRFRSLAIERESQIDFYLDAQAAVVRQITSRTRLRELLVALIDAPGDSDLDTSKQKVARILRDAIHATDNFQRIDVVDSTLTIVASNEINRIGRSFEERVVDYENRSRPALLANFTDGRLASPSLIAAPISVNDEQIAVAIVEIDIQQLGRRIESSRRAESSSSQSSPGGFEGQTLITDLASEQGIPDQLAGQFRPTSAQGFQRVDSNGDSFLVYWCPLELATQSQNRPTLWAFLPTTIAMQPLHRLRSLLCGTILFATVVNACIAYIAARKTESRLNRLARAAKDIVESGFSAELNVPDDSTFNALASAFDEMSGLARTKLEELQELADRERDEHSKLSSEIAIARQIQQCLYPDQPLRKGPVEVQGQSIAADTLCGDYFDYFVSGNEVVFAIGDVSGHGIGPALLMVEIRGVIRGLQWETTQLHEVVARLNQLLTSGVPSGRFVTLVLGRIDLNTGHIEYVSAGHRGYVVRADGSIETLPSNGLPVGLVEDTVYKARGFLLSAGESLVLTSDGIEETQNEAGELLGRDRVLETVAKARDQPLSEIIDAVLAESVSHGGAKAHADDRTLMVLRWGQPASG